MQAWVLRKEKPSTHCYTFTLSHVYTNFTNCAFYVGSILSCPLVILQLGFVICMTDDITLGAIWKPFCWSASWYSGSYII